jgi:hypothetical protein
VRNTLDGGAESPNARRLVKFAGAASWTRRLAIAGLAAALFGCSPPGEDYLANGIGSKLAASDVAQSTELLDLYFNHLCQQAGMAAESNCQAPLVDQAYWTLIVRQGMNDIDRRCDAYLEWLDNLKRSRAPILNEIGAAQTATQSIIEVTRGSAAAMSIVGLAFQLLSQSIENYHSRLILEVESSTINSVVLRAQHRFRTEVMDKAFNTRPDAEYVLRGYLRLCLPFAIETKINDFTTLSSQGILPDEEHSINQLPQAGRVPIEPTAPVARPARPRHGIVGGIGETEKHGDDRTARSIQDALCLAPDGTLGEQARAAIREFQSRLNDTTSGPKITGFVNKDELGILRDKGSCPAGLGNYTERIEFQNPAGVAALRAILKTSYPEIKDDATLGDLRPFIERKRVELGLDPGPGGMFANQATFEFLTKIDYFGGGAG